MPASKKSPTNPTPATAPDRNVPLKNAQPAQRDPQEGHQSSHNAKSHQKAGSTEGAGGGKKQARQH